jgi:hypothetical protein
MGWLTRLVDRIDARIDRPADQSVLTHSDSDGSERMLDSSNGQQESAAGKTVRRNRSRRRERWLGR